MATLSIDLDWWRCPQGYRIVRARDVLRASGYTDDSHPDEEWIIPNTNERAAYRPLDENDTICLAFAGCRTAGEFFRFVNLYGPITRTSVNWGDSIPTWLRVTQRFRELVAAKANGPKQLATAFSTQERASIARSYQAAGERVPADFDYASLDKLIGTAHVVSNPVSGLQMKIITDTLISGLWWQLTQKLSGVAAIRTCQYCSAPFESGPGTGKHIDAKFCSNEHKVRYFSLARTRSHKHVRTR